VSSQSLTPAAGFLHKNWGVLFQLTVEAGMTTLTFFPSTTFPFLGEVIADVGVGASGTRFGDDGRERPRGFV
jgi:hypothetical protein